MCYQELALETPQQTCADVSCEQAYSVDHAKDIQEIAVE